VIVSDTRNGNENKKGFGSMGKRGKTGMRALKR